MDSLEEPLSKGNKCRVLAVGVDSVAAASVLLSWQFRDYPPEPNSLRRVNGGDWPVVNNPRM